MREAPSQGVADSAVAMILWEKFARNLSKSSNSQFDLVQRDDVGFANAEPADVVPDPGKDDSEW